MVTKAVKKPIIARKAASVISSAPAAMRQRALELAVGVSAISYTYTAAGAWPAASSPGVRQRNYEDATAILATAQQFLDFMNR